MPPFTLTEFVITSFFYVKIGDYFTFFNLQVPVLLVDSRMLADWVGELTTRQVSLRQNLTLDRDDMLFLHGCVQFSLLFDFDQR